MEKAIAAGKRKPRAGLLSAMPRCRKALIGACAFFFCAFSLFAAETEMVMPEPPFVAGQPLTFSFLFYGTSPGAVFFEGETDGGNAANSFYYIEESFPHSFLIESVRKSLSPPSRQGVFAGSRTRAALVTIEATPQVSGSFDIGPFSFIVGEERVTFPLVRILVERSNSSSGAQGDAIELFWLIQAEEGSKLIPPAEARGLEAGRGALIVLMAPLQAEGNVTTPAPENALLEVMGVNPLELITILPPELSSAYTPAACYIWTPLFAGRQGLPRAAFSSIKGGDVSFAEEAVVEVVAPQIAKIAQADEEILAPALPPPSLPKKPDELTALATDTRFEASLAAVAADLWDAGEYAKAAVILRAAENVFPFSRRIAEMRGAVDAALSTEGKSCGAAERALFFAPFALIALALILFASLILYSLILGKKGGRRLSLFSKKKIIVVCIILAALAASSALYTHLSGGMEEAAATGGFLFRVPDEEAAAVVELKDGAPLKIERRAQSWLYVKTCDGAVGWYPSSKIIVYTVRDLYEFW